MRASGVLLPVSGLPGEYGIGCFSKEAYKFVDFLEKAGQKYWQILPVGPTSYGDSPYQSFSTFAGNPYFISLESLVEQGLLKKKECDEADFGKLADSVDYHKLYLERFQLLRKAYERSNITQKEEFHDFRRENAFWLNDYAVFMAVKTFFGGKSFEEWPEDIRRRWEYALNYYRRELYYDIEFYEYIQYEFYRQWFRLKKYANEKGIKIIGDIPIYVAYDSADVWAHPELFQMDAAGKPQTVAGCPPDGFSATGQLWGNPLYRWDYHRDTGFSWWIRRMEKCTSLYDVTRIDHFRGFDQYFSIPAGADDATAGHWEQGPGISLFHAIRARLGDIQIIAEDLGYITDSVRKLVWECGFPNMKVLEFAFDSRDSSGPGEYLPHNYNKNCVVYTGTHDNETLLGWLDNILPEEVEMVKKYVGRDTKEKKELVSDLIRVAQSSVADYCIIPIQDYLCLDNGARINTPSTVGTNWKWRVSDKQLSNKLAEKIKEYAVVYGRI